MRLRPVHLAALCCMTAASLLLLQSVLHNTRPQAPALPANATLPKILCFVLTQPSHWYTRARAVSDTWAQRCDGVFFLSASSQKLQTNGLPLVFIQMQENYRELWLKTRNAFEFIYDHHLSQYDFFLKADDDTYVIVENLRHFLRNTPPTQPIVAGRRFRPFTRRGYMSGGGGYVLSRAAVARLVELGFRAAGGGRCRKRWGPEDLALGRCLEDVGVEILDSIDALGRERFHPFSPQVHLNFDLYARDNWLRQYNYHPVQTGLMCCSDTAISFHYVRPMKMLEMHYFVYQLRASGVAPDAAESLRRPVLISGSIASPGSIAT